MLQAEPSQVQVQQATAVRLYPANVGPIHDDFPLQLKWYLPGWGDSLYDCGSFLWRAGCPDYRPVAEGETKHTRRVVLKHCHRPSCPTCYESWAKREGFACMERFIAAKTLYEGVGVRLGPVRHFAFSPPQKEAKRLMETKRGFEKLRRWYLKVIDIAGLTGGNTVFHAFREQGEDDFGEGGKPGSWYLSPHFHTVAYGWVIPSDEFHEGDLVWDSKLGRWRGRRLSDSKDMKKTGLTKGWVYKNAGVRVDIAQTILYQLSHCGLGYEKNPGGIEDDSHLLFKAVTWFGLLGPKRMKIVGREAQWVTFPCEVCGRDLWAYDPEDEEWVTPLHVYMVKHRMRVFALKGRRGDKRKEADTVARLRWNRKKRSYESLTYLQVFEDGGG